MTSAFVRDPLADYLFTLHNAPLLLIDYQLSPLAGAASMDRALPDKIVVPRAGRGRGEGSVAAIPSPTSSRSGMPRRYWVESA